MALTREQQIQAIEKDWAENPRWKGIKRGYSAEDVVNLRGSLQPVHTLAQRGADKLWGLIHGDAKKGYVNCLGALTGGQAVQQAQGGDRGDLPLRLAGGGGQQLVLHHVSGSVPLPG